MVFLKYDATTVTEYTEPKPKPKPKPKPRTRAKASTAGGKRNHTSRTGAVSRSDRLRYFQQGLILLEEKEEDLPSNLAPTKTETDMTPNTTKPLPYVPKRSISLDGNYPVSPTARSRISSISLPGCFTIFSSTTLMMAQLEVKSKLSFSCPTSPSNFFFFQTLALKHHHL